MRHLITAPFAYRGRPALAFALLALVACTVLSLLADSPRAALRIWRLYVLAIGLGTSIYLFSIDHFERRDLLWNTLPLNNRSIGIGRLTMPLIVQLTATLLAAVGMSILYLLAPLTSPSLDASLLTILGSQAINLVLIGCIYFNEELSIRLSRRRWAALALNIGLAPAFALILVGTDLIKPYDSWNSILFCHLAAVLAAGLSLYLFSRRGNHMVGINAWTGLPENWSNSAS